MNLFIFLCLYKNSTLPLRHKKTKELKGFVWKPSTELYDKVTTVEFQFCYEVREYFNEFLRENEQNISKTELSINQLLLVKWIQNNSFKNYNLEVKRSKEYNNVFNNKQKIIKYFFDSKCFIYIRCSMPNADTYMEDLIMFFLSRIKIGNLYEEYKKASNYIAHKDILEYIYEILEIDKKKKIIIEHLETDRIFDSGNLNFDSNKNSFSEALNWKFIQTPKILQIDINHVINVHVFIIQEIKTNLKKKKAYNNGDLICNNYKFLHNFYINYKNLIRQSIEYNSDIHLLYNPREGDCFHNLYYSSYENLYKELENYSIDKDLFHGIEYIYNQKLSFCNTNEENLDDKNENNKNENVKQANVFKKSAKIIEQVNNLDKHIKFYVNILEEIIINAIALLNCPKLVFYVNTSLKTFKDKYCTENIPIKQKNSLLFSNQSTNFLKDVTNKIHATIISADLQIIFDNELETHTKIVEMLNENKETLIGNEFLKNIIKDICDVKRIKEFELFVRKNEKTRSFWKYLYQNVDIFLVNELNSVFEDVINFFVAKNNKIYHKKILDVIEKFHENHQKILQSNNLYGLDNTQQVSNGLLPSSHELNELYKNWEKIKQNENKFLNIKTNAFTIEITGFINNEIAFLNKSCISTEDIKKNISRINSCIELAESVDEINELYEHVLALEYNVKKKDFINRLYIKYMDEHLLEILMEIEMQFFKIDSITIYEGLKGKIMFLNQLMDFYMEINHFLIFLTLYDIKINWNSLKIDIWNFLEESQRGHASSNLNNITKEKIINEVKNENNHCFVITEDEQLRAKIKQQVEEYFGINESLNFYNIKHNQNMIVEKIRKILKFRKKIIKLRSIAKDVDEIMFNEVHQEMVAYNQLYWLEKLGLFKSKFAKNYLRKIVLNDHIIRLYDQAILITEKIGNTIINEQTLQEFDLSLADLLDQMNFYIKKGILCELLNYMKDIFAGYNNLGKKQKRQFKNLLKNFPKDFDSCLSKRRLNPEKYNLQQYRALFYTDSPVEKVLKNYLHLKVYIIIENNLIYDKKIDYGLFKVFLVFYEKLISGVENLEENFNLHIKKVKEIIYTKEWCNLFLNIFEDLKIKIKDKKKK